MLIILAPLGCAAVLLLMQVQFPPGSPAPSVPAGKNFGLTSDGWCERLAAAWSAVFRPRSTAALFPALLLVSLLGFLLSPWLMAEAEDW